MKKDEITKWRESPDQEIVEKIDELKKRMYNFRHQLRLGQLKNHSQIRAARRDIARLKTFQASRSSK